MSTYVTRRNLIRGGASLALATCGAIARSGFDEPKGATAQDGSSIAIAMLDSHAEKLEPLFDAYAEQTGVDIEVTSLEYEELYLQVSLALTQQAQTYDVVSLEDDWIPQFASLLTPIDQELIPREQIIPVAFDLTRYPSDAHSCGLPWLGDAQFFAARSQWLNSSGLSVPNTWDDVNIMATSLEAAIEEKGSRGAFAISSLTAHQLVDSFLPILRGYGTDLIDQETGVPQLDTPEALGAIATFQQLAEYSPEESGATGASTNVERFQVGDVAMMANFWSSDLLAASDVEEIPNAGPIVIDMQPSQELVPHRSMSGIWIAGIPVGSEQKASAQSMVSWLASEPVQQQLVDLHLPPVLTPVYSDVRKVAAQPSLPQLLDLVTNSTPRPRSPYYPQLEHLLAMELEAMLRGEQAGDEAMRNANIAIREFLAREGVLPA